MRLEAKRLWHDRFRSGREIERGEFKRMTGLRERTTVSPTSALIKRELLRRDSPQGNVGFGLLLHALRFYCLALWPQAEAEADAAITLGGGR